MKKSICILTLARCGSTVLQEYLVNTKNLIYAGEFLCLHGKPKIFHARHINDTGIFFSDHIIDEDNIDHKENDIGLDEFKERVKLIQNFSKKYGPVVTKCFINYIRESPHFLEILSENFDIIVLSRRNSWLSILSYFICKESKIWHEYESEEKIKKSKEIINSTKIIVDEKHFYYRVMHNNFLTTIQKNIKYFNPDAMSLYFEDYENNAVDNLNKIFNEKMAKPMLGLVKLIDNHESNILNLDRIKLIYNKYSLKE